MEDKPNFGTTDWTLAEVPPAFAQVSALAWSFGYNALLFGSVVKAGHGRDLDILMHILFGETKRQWREFLAHFGGTMMRQLERPERHVHSYEVAKDGKLYHFIFGGF